MSACWPVPPRAKSSTARFCRRRGLASSIGIRMITQGPTPSRHVGYKQNRINQNHNEGIAVQTETTINDTTDFEIERRLINPRCGSAVRFLKRVHKKRLTLAELHYLWVRTPLRVRHHERMTLLIPGIPAPIPPQGRRPATAESERKVHPETSSR
jgi:hypothetical protein